KVAKMLGLGFPGGPIIDKLASKGNPKFVNFPRSLLDERSYDFSFSGIKTAVLYWLRDHRKDALGDQLISTNGKLLWDLCASFQAAVIDVLVEKTMQAARRCGVKDVAIAGGVSANSELRQRMQDISAKEGRRLFIPQFQYCTDNAAMIALLGWMKLRAGQISDSSLNAVANLSL
ncbi:MAG: tRNA (adenosine(37)-N6)-threonylcarbamoyltransferase complex transferase subunit TsaD, partial [Ignavibacteria bacterium]|nr:tRNA (adenosine(37)-N6)-threonylcarbamoyltransferase complex transferase subunit TsaD [Ignavibacteria bacterium]